MIPDNVRSWLIRLYPQSWRERYSVEFDLLLEQCLHSPLDVVDVILGALDAHLQLMNGENVNWRIMNMVNKLRSTLLVVFAAFIGFIIAGSSLVGLADDSPMIPLMKTNHALAAAWTTIQVGAAVALLAVVVGGLPLALVVVHRALTTDQQTRGLLLVPVFAFVVLVLYLGFVVLVSKGSIHIAGIFPVVPSGNFPLGNRLMMAGLMLVFILGAIASTLAVWKVVSHTDSEQESIHIAGKNLAIKIYAFAKIPAVITTLSMLVMLTSTLIWGWLAFSALPTVFNGDFGPWQTSTQAWFYGIAALMSLSTLAAFLGLSRSKATFQVT